MFVKDAVSRLGNSENVKSDFSISHFQPCNEFSNRFQLNMLYAHHSHHSTIHMHYSFYKYLFIWHVKRTWQCIVFISFKK